MTKSEEFKQDLAGFSAMLFVGSILAGMGILGWQLYVWLRSSIWMPLSALTVMDWVGMTWAYSPRDWIGFNKLLGYIPLAIAVPGVGMALAGALLSFTED